MTFPRDAADALAAFLPLTAKNDKGEILVIYDDKQLKMEIIERGEQVETCIKAYYTTITNVNTGCTNTGDGVCGRTVAWRVHHSPDEGWYDHCGYARCT